MRIFFGYQDTRNNKEDFAITPYLFSVLMKGDIIKICGIGMCWGYWAFYIAIGKNVPSNVPTFLNHNLFKSEK